MWLCDLGDSCHVNMPHLLSESFLTAALAIPDRPQLRRHRSVPLHFYLGKHLTVIIWASAWLVWHMKWNRQAWPLPVLGLDFILAQTEQRYLFFKVNAPNLVTVYFTVGAIFCQGLMSVCEFVSENLKRAVRRTHVAWAHLSQSRYAVMAACSLVFNVLLV